MKSPRAPAGLSPSSTIGVIAPSGLVPAELLTAGVERLRTLGVHVRVHPQTRMKERYFAGTDFDRARAFLEYAYDDSIDTLWAARGGFGAIRILPFLEAFARQHGKPPRKRLFGFSDVTLLMEFVRTRWNWSTVHAPMPGTTPYQSITPREWRAVENVYAARSPVEYRLKALYLPKKESPITAPLLGGNLTMIATSVGTPYAFRLKGGIVFLEEVGEAMYAMDRDLRQLILSGAFENVRAIVLGTFSGCEDRAAAGTRKPLSPRRMIDTLFREVGEALRIPIYLGLPVGHGTEGNGVLPLGERATIRGSRLTVRS